MNDVDFITEDIEFPNLFNIFMDDRITPVNIQKFVCFLYKYGFRFTCPMSFKEMFLELHDEQSIIIYARIRYFYEKADNFVCYNNVSFYIYFDGRENWDGSRMTTELEGIKTEEDLLKFYFFLTGKELKEVE
jgi:hypothetical protein